MLAHFISITVAIAAPFRRGSCDLRRSGPGGSTGRAHGARPLDGRRDPLAPRLAVPEDGDAGLDVLDPRQRIEARGGAQVERARHELRAARAGDRVERAERVAEDEHALPLEVEGAVA